MAMIKTRISFIILLFLLVSCGYCSNPDLNTDSFLLKVDYIQDANSITLSSGKRLRLAGVSIPDLYGKNSQWIGLDEKTMFSYNTEAKDFIKNLVYVTETKKPGSNLILLKTKDCPVSYI